MSDENFNLLLSRRSHYRFTTKPVSDLILVQLVRAGDHAPSSRGAQPWAFVVVRDPARLAALLADRRQAKAPPHHVAPTERIALPDAPGFAVPALPPVALVVCGDPARLDDEAGLALSCACAAQNVLLAAHALGLGAGWVFCYGDAEREARICSLLRAPASIRPVCLILLGYPAITTLLPKAVRPTETLMFREFWGVGAA
jgi:nitroreductase